MSETLSIEQADARLIAAAPKLLSLVREYQTLLSAIPSRLFLHRIGAVDSVPPDVWDQVRYAIQCDGDREAMNMMLDEAMYILVDDVNDALAECAEVIEEATGVSAEAALEALMQDLHARYDLSDREEKPERAKE